MKTLREKRQALFFIYLTTFITTIGFALIVYINSSFLKKFLGTENVGFVYGIGSLISLIILSKVSSILKKIGHFKMMLSILALEIIAITSSSLLDLYKNNYADDGAYIEFFIVPLLVVLSFFLYNSSALLLRFSLDLYLEKFSNNKSTGLTRGIFLTTINIAIAISPFAVGKILTNGDFYRVYMISALVFLPALTIALLKFGNIPDIQYEKISIKESIKKLWSKKDIRNIFISNFLLEFFYSWMVIYTPIYLNEKMGFSWGEIGTMLSIVLSVFVILQLPLGRIADKYLGEKEILTAGYIIAGISTLIIFFINKPDFILWTVVLYAGRLGVAGVEIMNETYFFKKVSPKDHDIISLYREASPLAYISGPILASIIISFMGIEYLFPILSIIMFSGIKFSLAIKDTK